MPIPPLPAPVDRALRAANGGDIDGFLAAFADDGAVNDWGREFRGQEEIRGWSDREFIGRQVTLEVTAVRTRGDTTTVSLQVGGNANTGPSDFAFTVQGDRIAMMRITG
ncbi:nuclear transport factor 2 family protein [Streptomyces sp. NPDC048483]|uniref:nuclear transport factor 2 family protein n=1 Tax=Streptomyces sp. NPDC048483 TaxID=3154927 RepID=UPI00342F5781